MRFLSINLFTLNRDKLSIGAKKLTIKDTGDRRTDDQTTVCPESLDPFYIVHYYINWVKTSWTYINKQTDRKTLKYGYTYKKFCLTLWSWSYRRKKTLTPLIAWLNIWVTQLVIEWRTNRLIEELRSYKFFNTYLNELKLDLNMIALTLQVILDCQFAEMYK